MRYIKPLLLLIALALSLQALGQKKSSARFTVSGFIKERKSSETIPGANVYIPGTTTGTASNNYGFYSLSLPAGKVELTYSYVGYTPQKVNLSLQKDTTIDIWLSEIEDIESVIIEAKANNESSRSARMSSILVSKKAMMTVPMIFGERDVLKVVQLMPGVQKGREGTSGLYVRGGSSDQNLIILDEAPVYNAHHVLGFFSLFNGSAVKSLEMVKGGFPARYGGRLASVVEILMDEGNMREYHGSATIGLISSNAMVQGPIVKDKASFLFTGRRTYLDLLAKLIFKAKKKSIPSAYFYDVTGKINWIINKKNRIYFSSYLGNDQFDYASGDPNNSQSGLGLGWGNITGTVRWNSVLSSEVFSNLTAIYSRYGMDIAIEQKNQNGSYFQGLGSRIQNVGLKWDISWNVHPSHSLRMGYHFIGNEFTPSIFVQNVSQDDISVRNQRFVYTMENTIYFEDDWKLWSFGKANIGVRFSHYATKDGYQDFSIEPRLSTVFYLTKSLSMKASFAMTTQNLHLLTGYGFRLPTDLWVPATKNVPSEHGWIASLGGVYDIPAINSQVTVEGYYKRYNGNITYKEGASYLYAFIAEQFGRSTYESLVAQGRGESYGLELLFQRKLGKLTGWFSYTLAFSKHQFPELNDGKPFWSTFDRRHDLSLVMMYQFNKQWSMSGSFTFGSGQPLTLLQGEFATFEPTTKMDDGRPYPAQPVTLRDYGQLNGVRMEPYHRLDLGVQYRKEFKYVELLISMDIYNAYCNYNPFLYSIDEDYNVTKNSAGTARIEYKKQLVKLALFPIIPTFSFTLKF